MKDPRRPRLLIVEDEKNARDALGETFAGEHEVRLAEDVAQALAVVQREPVDLVLTDVVLPGEKDGLDLLKAVKALQPETPVIVMTAYGSVERAVRAMRDGAHDFLEKPLDLKRLRAVIASALAARRQAPASAAYRAGLLSQGAPPGFVGVSPVIREVFRVVGKAAPTNATLLILGESGTGKELVAQAVHRASPRAAGPFIKVNCAALPEGLLEAELFGHARGAFTGAQSERVGRFEAAHGGTLFLDEVGEVPLHTQVKLLRALQNREVERLGENRTRAVDVRVVAATNADLDAKVRKGELREDFYFRLKVISIRMPTLRERRADIPLLAEHFRALYAERHGRRVERFSPAAMELLEAYDWPGNVRELENLVEAAVVLCEGDEITLAVLPIEVGGQQRVEDLPETTGALRIPHGTTLPEAEKLIILDTLVRTGGNKTAAARILGLGLRTLYRKLEEYGSGAPQPGAPAP